MEVLRALSMALLESQLGLLLPAALVLRSRMLVLALSGDPGSRPVVGCLDELGHDGLARDKAEQHPHQ